MAFNITFCQQQMKRGLMLPPHNVIVEDRPDLGHESLAMLPGEEFDVVFNDPGDYTYWCAPHKGAGMIGTVHVE